MFVYQPIFSMLDLKEDKDTDYIPAWKSERLFKSRFESLYKAFLPNIKKFRCKIGIHFNKSALVVVKNNYSTKTVNIYSAYDLDDLPRNSHNSFKLKK